MSNSRVKPKIIVILGPNASGKSSLAIELAKKFGGEVISADSRQVYKGLNIGSGKITKKEMRGIPHHLIDVVSPKNPPVGGFTVSDYQKLAKKAMEKIISRNKIPIICGGTGLYIDALIYNHAFPSAPPDPKLRRKLEKKSAEELFKRLKKLDPKRAAVIDRHNKRRLVRALEIVLKTKKPVPPLKKESAYDALKIGVKWPDEKLKARIKERLLSRLKSGMINEVKKLHSPPTGGAVSWKRLYDLGLEYRYISLYLREILSKEEMTEKLEKETWHYAKRQMTWFKRDKEIIWLKKPAKKEAMGLVKEFLEN